MQVTYTKHSPWRNKNVTVSKWRVQECGKYEYDMFRGERNWTLAVAATVIRNSKRNADGLKG
jgi:hypothetical protein